MLAKERATLHAVGTVQSVGYYHLAAETDGRRRRRQWSKKLEKHLPIHTVRVVCRETCTLSFQLVHYRTAFVGTLN